MRVYVSPRLVFIWETCPRSLWEAFFLFLELFFFFFPEIRTFSSHEVQIRRDFSSFLLLLFFCWCIRSVFVESIVYDRHDRQIVATARP